MNNHELAAYIRQLAARDGRYQADAFFFVSEAISYTVAGVRQGQITVYADENRGREGEFHVSGRELLEGIRLLARERWGVLAPTVFRSWGVTRTEDFGEIVFCMVEDENLAWSKRDSDSRDDFRNGYDFAAAFAF